MDVYDMLSAIIKKYGFESKEAIGFASDVESGSSLDWLQFLYYETMEKGEDLYWKQKTLPANLYSRQGKEQTNNFKKGKKSWQEENL